MEDQLLHTPLESVHLELGAKMVPFGGWYLPVQYTSILDEHAAVRHNCGVFDISHMGQLLITGADAESWLNKMLANNVAVLAPGSGQYSFLLNDNGGVIDDLIIYRESTEQFFAVVNAARIDQDFSWMNKHLAGNVALDNQSSRWAGMAVQGPDAPALFAKIFPSINLPSRNGILRFSWQGKELIVCRTGYTGEDGFEFFSPAADAGSWFKSFIDGGAKPCGLGARDSLRLEMGYPLNGNDLSEERTPIEAGLGVFVDLQKDDFIGRDALLRQKEQGFSHKLVALQSPEKGAPPRVHYAVETPAGEVIGELCSGVLSPSLMLGIGMAYLPVAYAKPGTELSIDVRGRKFPVIVVKKPFYKHPAKQA